MNHKKSKCLFFKEGLVLNEDLTKTIAHCFCEIDEMEEDKPCTADACRCYVRKNEEMKLDEIKDRLMKMKALANAGVGGERANAEKLLAEIAARYGISLEDINGEKIEKHDVKITQHWQNKLLVQLAAIMRQEKRKHGEVLRDEELTVWRTVYGKYCKVTKYYVYATKCDMLELTAKFEVLKADYKRQQKNFYLAFLMANDLLTDPDDDTPELTREEEKSYKEAAFMSLGITKSNTNKQLENIERKED